MNDDYSWLEEPTPDADQSSAEAAPGARRRWRRLLRLPRLRRGRSAESAASQPSATDLLGSQSERPLTELDERLQALHARTSGVPETDTHQELFAVDELLTTPALQEKPGGVITAVALSRGQQQQVDLLTEIVTGQQDAPQMRSLRGRGGSAARLSLRALPRLLVSAVLLLFVALPFASSEYALDVMPPGDFPADDPAGADFYRAMEGIAPGDYVLVAVEYGLGAAAELDPLTDLALRHIFARGGRVILATSNPIAFVHIQNLINDIRASVRDAGLRLEARRDYALLRYLPGGALGLRELSENFADLLRLSTGAAPPVRALDDLALVLLIAESADDVRNWAEQVLPETSGLRLYAATSLAAEPLARAWVDSLDAFGGLVAGLPAAYTYSEKLAAGLGEPPVVVTRDVEPPGEVTPTPQPTSTAIPTIMPTAQPPTALPTLPPTLPPPPVDAPTIPPPLTAPPGLLPTLDATPRPLPTAQATLIVQATSQAEGAPAAAVSAPTATPPPTATATPALVRAVEVVSLQSPVNIRTGPGTTFETLGLAYWGDIYEALDANSDASWYKIRMANGWEGWIAAILVEEKTLAETELSGNESASAARTRTLLSAQRPRRYSKTEPRFSQVSLPDLSIQSAFVQLRERQVEPARMQALAMGTIAAVLAIVVGNLVALFGAFGRRK